MADGLNVLITGGAGYLGSVMTPALLAAGHRVTVLDAFIFQQNSLSEHCLNPGFDVHRGDARDERLIKDLAPKADVVIPLAALVGAPVCNFDETTAVTTNRDAVLMLLKHLSSEQRLLMPITNSGYGIGEKGKYCTEETPLRPISLYGKTKVEAERAVLAHGAAISFRLATVFGMAPRMRIDLLVNDFVHRAVTDRAVVLFEAHFKRNFIHVRDIARVFLHGLDNFEIMQGEAYNVGLSDANLSNFELCEKIKQHVPNFQFLEAPIGEDPDKRDYIVSNEKIEKTGYLPAYSLDDGIAELIKGYKMIKNTVYGNF
jgi:nucleoside-diphosphate-sugar epimerase